MKQIILLLVFLFGVTPEISIGQANQAQADAWSKLLGVSICGGNFQSGKKVCEIILPRSVDAKVNKTGDHIILRTILFTSSTEEPITMLDAVIVGAQSRANGDSILRIRIDKGVRKDGREVPIEARIVLLASQSSVIERRQSPAIIVDRFPRIPEDDERLPGERKLSEDQPHTSPLDSMGEVPVHYRVVCLNKKTKASASACTNLLEARGVYGYDKLTLEPADAASPAESVLSSKKNIALRTGTVLVVEVKNVPQSL
jgi:hypothetical protein